MPFTFGGTPSRICSPCPARFGRDVPVNVPSLSLHRNVQLCRAPASPGGRSASQVVVNGLFSQKEQQDTGHNDPGAFSSCSSTHE